jgi:acyl transferase domain-containing protein
VLTAPHPEAQEELILGACQDAGIQPQEIAYVECHGTGTKIGDPIEITAIQNTLGLNRSDPCLIGSVKSNIGHLESAAGIAGLIKAVTAVNHGIIPPNLHFQTPNQHIDFETGPLQVVTEETPIDQQANIGISSFGFGGSNAHLVIQGAEDALRKAIAPIKVPFDRFNATPLDTYLRLQDSDTPAEEAAADAESSDLDVRAAIQSLLFNVTGVNEIDPHLELIEQGLDSMSATELLRTLEEKYHIELEPEVLFEFPLFDEFTVEIEKRIAS